MKQLIAFLLTLLTSVTISQAQPSHFYGQKNIFSFNVRINPRLLAIRNDGTEPEPTGTSYGTYTQSYDENGNIITKQQKVNLMLNASYTRMIAARAFIGIEFNYQKHNFTMHEAGFSDFLYYFDDDGELHDPKEFTASTPVFNVFDIKLISGKFLGSNIAPGNHRLHYGAGVTVFSLDKTRQYHYDANTPIPVERLMQGYDKTITLLRLTVGYTYRILLTKNLSLNIGVDGNLGLFTGFTPQDGYPNGYLYFYQNENTAIYNYGFIRNRLGHETFFNIIYFRGGLSFAI